MILSRAIFVCIVVADLFIVSTTRDLCCPRSEHFLSDNVAVDRACGDVDEVPFDCAAEHILVQSLHPNYTFADALISSNDTWHLEDGHEYTPAGK
jgi:hypothetical protein